MDYDGQTIIIEFSSPNIAKPFHAGHLRSTIIGNFLRNLYRTLGTKTIAINYLGDWGTQYGLLALGFQKFGSEQNLIDNPIRHLFEVYVAANKHLKDMPEFKDQARAYFKRMEDGDPEILSLWKRFRDLSIIKYQEVYERLNIKFDVYSGESQMSNGIANMIKTFEDNNLLTIDSKLSKIVDLKDHKLNACVIMKKDGATLYITRDLVAAKTRYDEYKFDKCIYVVSSQQDLHFQQLFKMLELMGYSWYNKCQHINFGMV